MTWYAAHAVMLVEFADGIQTQYPVWENILLIQSETSEAARAMAEARAKQDEGDSNGTFTWEDRPARWVFAGIRKVVACEDADAAPGHGTEVTYLQLDLPDSETFEHFIQGDPVKLTYEG